MTEPADVFQFLVSEGRSIILDRYTPTSCIASTRIGLDVLRHFGIRAYPIAVRTLAFNKTAADLVKRGVPMDDWPEGAWSIGIEGTGQNLDRQWDGHLILGTRWADGVEVVADLSADQFSRPGYDLVVHPVWFTAPVWPTGVTTENGSVVIYERIGSKAYKSAADWNRDRARPTVQRIIEAMAS